MCVPVCVGLSVGVLYIAGDVATFHSHWRLNVCRLAAGQSPDKVKSHAVDWSAFSALEQLRAEEEEGDLGDFSVFGSTLKRVSESEVDIATARDKLLIICFKS